MGAQKTARNRPNPEAHRRKLFQQLQRLDRKRLVGFAGVFLHPSNPADNAPRMSLTEIIFRLFAWARPLLWYYHRLGHFLDIAILCLKDDDYCLWLLGNPAARAGFESKLTDGERCLEKAIAFRVREILGLPMPATTRMGIGGFHRIHSAPSLERLAARLDRLVDRYNDIERLAQLRAARLKREMDAAPVLLVADHRPANPPPALLLSLLSSTFFQNGAFLRAAVPAGLPIRAPP
jgi:hypothetical protein